MNPASLHTESRGIPDKAQGNESRMLPHDMLVLLSDYLRHYLGLYFPQKKWNELERLIGKSLTEFHFNDIAAFVDWLLSSAPPTRSQIEILASHLTIGETYFFRDKRVFEMLEERILPGLIRTRRGIERRIRVWSAGCCTGEEPYSIAILLSKLVPDWRDWNISILATDINPRFLQKASRALYGPWSFRDCPPWVQAGYFRKDGRGLHEIVPDIRNMVTFAYHNLVDDPYPSLANHTNAMDVIFCRNVLIYFSEETARGVTSNLSRCLVNEGWLVTSPVESHFVPPESFAAVHFGEAVVFRNCRGPRKETQMLLPLPDERHEEAAEPVQTSLNQPFREHVLPIPEIREPLAMEEPEIGTNDTQEIPWETAKALYEHGHYSEAARELLKLAVLDSNTVNILSLLSRAYANQGNLSEACKWCERAIAYDKFSPSLHYLQATILQEQGANEEALRSLKRSLYLDPDLVLAHFAMGTLNRQRGKNREANKNFENVLLLLRNYSQEQILPESDGITAGRLREVIRAIQREKELACQL